MQVSNNRLGSDFHMKEAIKFNKLYTFFKFSYHLSPFLLILFVYERSLWILIGVIIFALASWLLSVKTKSLRNINYYAAKTYRGLHDKDMIKMFK